MIDSFQFHRSPAPCLMPWPYTTDPCPAHWPTFKVLTPNPKQNAMHNPCAISHVTWQWSTYWAVRLLAVHAKSLLNIYVWLQKVTQKVSDRKYSTQHKRITMMHLIVSKEQITYLKTLFIWLKFKTRTTYAHTHSHIYASQHICTYTHAHINAEHKLYNYSTEVRSPSKLSTHNPYAQGLQNNQCCL